MNSTPNPKTIEADDVLVARADERLAHAYAQIARADEQLARVNETLSKLERDGARQSPAPNRRTPRGRSALRGLVGLLLAACIFAAAFVSQSSYGDAAKLIVGWGPQRIATSSPPLQQAGLTAQPDSPAVQLAVADQVADQPIPPPPTAPQDVAPTAIAAPELAQLLQTMARDLASLEQGVEQLKASLEQTARENAKANEELKAGQEQMARLVAKSSEQKASEQNLRPRISAASAPSTAPAPRGVATPARKPVAPLPSSQARSQPRAPTQLQPELR